MGPNIPGLCTYQIESEWLQGSLNVPTKQNQIVQTLLFLWANNNFSCRFCILIVYIILYLILVGNWHTFTIKPETSNHHSIYVKQNQGHAKTTKWNQQHCPEPRHEFVASTMMSFCHTQRIKALSSGTKQLMIVLNQQWCLNHFCLKSMTA